jgi:hypothetical protein
VDDTYLYERFSEKLLIAIAFDTDNEIFSLAYALVEEENNVNRSSFYDSFNVIL